MCGATQTLGAEVVAQALPLLQPAALSTATRTSARSRPGLLDELRERAAAAAGTEPPELEPLTRVSPGTLLALVTVGLAVHLLLPQVSQLRPTLDALGAARWGWLVAGLAWSAVSFLAAAVAQLGAVGAPLPLGRTTMVQLAGSFTRLTPAGLGEAGLNVRYLQRAGLDRPTAVNAVGVKTAVGALAHVLGLLVALLLVVRTRLHPADVPGRWPLLVGLVAVLVGGGLVLWRALGRQRLLAPALRAGRALAEIRRRPAKAAQLVGGSAAVTLAYALALASCLAAFDVHLPLASTAATYLVAAAVAAASPLPGGLVAMEAALVVGLTAAGAPAGPAVAGVLAFRLVTFWLPILPGWLAYRRLRAAGTI
jgi:undecaprenyl-diphosphatase